MLLGEAAHSRTRVRKVQDRPGTSCYRRKEASKERYGHIKKFTEVRLRAFPLAKSEIMIINAEKNNERMLNLLVEAGGVSN